MLDRLREQWRARLGRGAAPTAGVIDSQTARGLSQGGGLGWGGGKKVKGREHHLVVDTISVVLAASVGAASTHDSAAAANLVV